MNTIRHHLRLEIFFVTLAAFIGVFLAVYSNIYSPKFSIFSSIPIMPEEQVPKATPTPPLPKPQTASQVSPDGTKQVVMKTVFNKDGTQTYIFSTADSSGNNEQAIFTKTLDNARSMSIPFNTWSPDNKYFFIQEQTKDDSVTNVFVFKGSGEPIANKEKYFDVTDIFSKRNTGNNFDKATGWASETLIIFNTRTLDDVKGPSYWFELPSKAVIQLSTDF